jgi:hypothetical protein
MKLRFLIPVAAVLTFAACDGEKVQEAKKEGAEAAKAAGEAAKEVTGKASTKIKEMAHETGEKLKAATEAAKEAITTRGGPAMDTFKAKMGGLSEWFKQAQGKAGEDPAKAHQLMADMMGRVKGISSEGLPPEVKTSFERFRMAMNQVQDVSKSLPSDAAGQAAWYKDNANKLAGVEKEFLSAAKSLKEECAKHGLTNLDLGGE